MAVANILTRPNFCLLEEVDAVSFRHQQDVQMFTHLPLVAAELEANRKSSPDKGKYAQYVYCIRVKRNCVTGMLSAIIY